MDNESSILKLFISQGLYNTSSNCAISLIWSDVGFVADFS